jgi:hypothetical protein
VDLSHSRPRFRRPDITAGVLSDLRWGPAGTGRALCMSSLVPATGHERPMMSAPGSGGRIILRLTDDACEGTVEPAK